MRFIITFLAALCSLPAAAGEPLAAVASNLSKPMEVLSAQFTAARGARVRFSFGSSGDLLRQIRQGAPFELFIAASADYTDRAHSAGLTEGTAVVLANANMGVLLPAGSPLESAVDLDALGRLIAGGKYRRIAMANPEVAPFGVAARQALQKMGVWTLERDRVVMGENVAQTVQFTLAGGVDAGFIPQSYALLPEVARAGRYLPIPGAWHEPLAQSMVLLRGAGADARAFFEFLQSPEARQYLARSGYSVPIP